ncbi:isochorismatase [Vallitalea longa]|uniref:Isochorismatase n=1 Tax=Vallitalea longa TaxID=2936439 RepID=A0A9W6DIH3_9FIRM|nr:isochorismatase family cysteine hydrolase [Vallitalea longa]GKX31909.1 isochorismatase [Vallitalea longa]
MKRAYLLIDYVYDFIDDQGVLSLGKRGQAIRPNILKVINDIKEKDETLYVCNDNHEKESYNYSPESKLFPLHCNKKGSKLAIDEELFSQIMPKRTYNISKVMYSSFNGTVLNLVLQQQGIRELVLMGVCTDICVLHTAIDAYNLGYEITVISDCCCGLTDEGHQFAINHFRNTLGANIITSKDI